MWLENYFKSHSLHSLVTWRLACAWGTQQFSCTLFQFVLLVLITFFAAMTNSITGFGFALLTLPFYVLILDLQSAVQLTLISTFIITIILIPFVTSVPINYRINSIIYHFR